MIVADCSRSRRLRVSQLVVVVDNWITRSPGTLAVFKVGVVQ